MRAARTKNDTATRQDGKSGVRAGIKKDRSGQDMAKRVGGNERRCGRHELPRGFEPPSLDSESRALAVTNRDRSGQDMAKRVGGNERRCGGHELPRGFEPPSLDSESRVLAVTYRNGSCERALAVQQIVERHQCKSMVSRVQFRARGCTPTHPPKRDMLLGYLGQHPRSRGHRALAPWRLPGGSLDDLEAYSHWTASGWSPVNDPKQFRTRASKFCKAIPCAIRATHRMLWVIRACPAARRRRRSPTRRSWRSAIASSSRFAVSTHKKLCGLHREGPSTPAWAPGEEPATATPSD